MAGTILTARAGEHGSSGGRPTGVSGFTSAIAERLWVSFSQTHFLMFFACVCVICIANVYVGSAAHNVIFRAPNLESILLFQIVSFVFDNLCMIWNSGFVLWACAWCDHMSHRYARTGVHIAWPFNFDIFLCVIQFPIPAILTLASAHSFSCMRGSSVYVLNR